MWKYLPDVFNNFEIQRMYSYYYLYILTYYYLYLGIKTSPTSKHGHKLNVWYRQPRDINPGPAGVIPSMLLMLPRYHVSYRVFSFVHQEVPIGFTFMWNLVSFRLPSLSKWWWDGCCKNTQSRRSPFNKSYFGSVRFFARVRVVLLSKFNIYLKESIRTMNYLSKNTYLVWKKT